MNYPKDLARRVHSTIKSKKSVDVPLSVLDDLFEKMFFSSLKTEELSEITYSVVYIDPRSPDVEPPKRKVADRWSLVEFDKQIPFSTSNIVKLAKASDPRSSSLAIYHDDNNEIFMWGLIDQVNNYSSFANYESEDGPEMPGIFQATVESQGYIVAYLDLNIIAELRQNRLVSNSVDVFKNGPVRDTLQPYINMHIKSIERSVDSSKYQDRDHWDETFSELWLSSLCRLLIRIRNFKHGGAILLSPTSNNDGLSIKYKARYDRLKNALLKRAISTIEKTYAEDSIFNIMDKENNIPLDMYLDESVSSSELYDIKNEIHGALWFLSLLNRVDGLMLFSKSLVLKGFGVEIITRNEPEKVYKSKSVFAQKPSLEELDFNHFGTRHRSMMRYCDHYKGSIGFVISQDGNVRVITKVHDKLIVWEDIKLNAQTYIPRLIRRKPANNRN